MSGQAIESMGSLAFLCPVQGCDNTRTAIQPRCRVHMRGFKHLIAEINFHDYPGYPDEYQAPTTCTCGWRGPVSQFQPHRRENGEANDYRHEARRTRSEAAA